MTAGRVVQVVVGLLITAAGAFMVMRPELVGIGLERPHETPVQMINLRATFGGTAMGIGGFLLWVGALRPWRRSILGLLMWTMLCIFGARLTGFILDGSPDTLQWVWLIAEAVIVVVCLVMLRRGTAAATA